MVNLITEFSKYAILTLMLIYTFSCVYLAGKPAYRQSGWWGWAQLFLIVSMYSIAFLVIAIKTRDYGVVVIYGEMLIFFLARMGLITADWLAARRKYAIVLAFVTGALLTPPDIISQTALAVPFVLLYETGIWVARVFGKKPEAGRELAPRS